MIHMPYIRLTSLSVAIFWLFLATAVAGALEIPIYVENPSSKEFNGVYRKENPVSGGIPLPEGIVYSDQALCLIDEDKNTVPVQISALTRYEDHSLHWILLSFLTELNKGETKKFKLVKKSEQEEIKQPVKTVKDAGSFIVSNGILECTFNQENPGVIDILNYKDNSIVHPGGRMCIVMADDTELIPQEEIHLELEYTGPIFTRLRFSGGFRDKKTGKEFKGFGYTLRVTMYAAASSIKLEYLLKNSCPDYGQHLHIRRAWLELPIENISAVQKGDDYIKFDAGRNTGIFQVRHSGAFKNDLKHMAAEDGRVEIDLIPAIEKKMDHSKSGTYYTNLDNGGGAYWLSDMSFKGTYINMYFSDETVKGLKNSVYKMKTSLHANTDSRFYADFDGLGLGTFGSLTDEIQTYQNWKWTGWDNKRKQPWGKTGQPDYQKQFLHVHDRSEADQIRGLTVQYVRTRGRSYLDRSDAWADFMKYHYVPRTEKFSVHGVVMSYKGWHWLKQRPMKTDTSGMIRWLERARADGCHDYGTGLGNYYLLTGDRESLAALKDLCEKYDILYHDKVPGKYETNPWGMRGIGRHLCAVTRAYSILRTDKMKNLMTHMARLILEDPQRDERGFIRKTRWLPSFKGLMNHEKCPAGILKQINGQKIRINEDKRPCMKDGDCWKVTTFAPWQQAIAAMGLYNYFRLTGDEDARDYLVAFSEAVKKYCISKACGHVYSYTTMGFPGKDASCNPMKFWDYNEHCKDGRPGPHDGWYTNRMVNSMVIGYVLSGRTHLLDSAKSLWSKGSKVNWWTLPKAAENEVYRFADIDWSTKKDDVSSVSLLFHEYAHPRWDKVRPEAIHDLKAQTAGRGEVRLSWTAPADDQGRVSFYQVKYAYHPIKSYKTFNFAEDEGFFVNWNMAGNLKNEPIPKAPGTKEIMEVSGLDGRRKGFFAVVSYDSSMNQSGLSNIAQINPK